MFKLKYLLVIFLMLLATMGVIYAEDIDDNTTSGEPIIVPEGNMDNIANAVDSADENSTLELEGDYTPSDNYVLFKKSLTVQGSSHGANITSDRSSKLSVLNGTVTFKNLIFNTNDYNRISVLISGGNALFINCTFNSSIICNKGNLTILNSTFNSYSHITKESDLDSIITIDNTRMINSRVNLYNPISKIEVTNSVFEDYENEFFYGEARIANFYNNTFMNFKNSVLKSKQRINVTNNRFKNCWYAINADFDVFKSNSFENVENAFIILNDTENVNIYNLTCSNSYFEITANQLSIEKSNLANSFFTLNANNIKILNSKFSKNAVIWAYGDLKNIIYLNGCEFENILHNEYTDQIINTYNSVSMENCKFKNCMEVISTDSSLTINNCNFEKTAGILANGKATIKNSHFTNSNLKSHLIYFDGSNKYSIDNCTFKNNKVLSLVYCQSYSLSVTNSIFKGNSGTRELIYVESKTFTLTGNAFSKNTFPEFLEWHHGKYTKNTAITITKNIFAYNYNSKHKMSEFHIDSVTKKVGDKLKILSSVNIANNFYGFNLESTYQLTAFDFLSGTHKTSTWINLKFSKTSNNNYQLKFIDNKGNTVGLKEYYFTIKDKSGNFIAKVLVKNGIGKFKSNKSLSLKNIYIYNEASDIVNKEKAKLTLSVTGKDYEHLQIKIKVLNTKGKPYKNHIVSYTYTADSFNYGLNIAETDKNGAINLKIPYLDKSAKSHNLKIEFAELNCAYTTVIKTFKVEQTQSVASIVKKTIPINQKELYIKVISKKTKLPIPKATGYLKLYKGSKLIKKSFFSINGCGFAKINTKNLKVGKYKAIIVMSIKGEGYKYKKVSTKIKIKKASTFIRAPSIYAPYKHKDYFKITVKDKNSKPVGKLKVKVKIFTGKKSKTYKLKTNKKGIIKFNTKNLKLGYHKVLITAKHKKITASQESAIKVIR